MAYDFFGGRVQQKIFVLSMEIRHDDFTVDVAENRILLATITRTLMMSAWLKNHAARSPVRSARRRTG